MEEHEKHHKKSKTLSSTFYKKLMVMFSLVLIIFALYNIYQGKSFRVLFEEKLAEAKEAARPAELQLTIISTTCYDCYDINAVVDILELAGDNITSKKELVFLSEEANRLIKEYQIDKVPTIIVTGELNKSRALSTLNSAGKELKGAYIFTKLEPPFIEASSGNIRGKITLTYLKKKNCIDCYDLNPIISQLIKSGLKFEKKQEIDILSSEGLNLIKKYDIKNVPTIIMDKEIEVYSTIIQSLNQLGKIEGDGTFIMHQIPPPYYSLEDKIVKGLVSMITLVDESCNRCYEPDKFHKPVLQRMGVVLKDEKTVDISSLEGQRLIDKYKIEKIPTILLVGDIEEYDVLVNACIA